MTEEEILKEIDKCKQDLLEVAEAHKKLQNCLSGLNQLEHKTKERIKELSSLYLKSMGNELDDILSQEIR